VLRSRQGAGVFVTEAQACRSASSTKTAESRATERLFELRGSGDRSAGSPRCAAAKTISERSDAAMAGLREDADSTDADLDFHRAVSRAAGNDYIATSSVYRGSMCAKSIAICRSTFNPAVIPGSS